MLWLDVSRMMGMRKFRRTGDEAIVFRACTTPRVVQTALGVVRRCGVLRGAGVCGILERRDAGRLRHEARTGRRGAGVLAAVPSGQSRRCGIALRHVAQDRDPGAVSGGHGYLRKRLDDTHSPSWACCGAVDEPRVTKYGHRL